MEELLKKWADRLINFEKRKDNGNNTLFERLECELKIQELETCFYELNVLADISHENSGLNIADVNGWLSFPENSKAFNELIKKEGDCLVKFDDGTILRFKEEFPLAVVTHFKPF